MNMIPFSRRNAPTPGPDCASYAPLLPVLDEPAADAIQMARAREHLRDCAHCQARVEAYERLDAALNRQFGFAVTPRLATENIMADIEEPVAPALYSAPSAHFHTATFPPPHGSDSRPPRQSRGKLSALASVAAALVIAVLASFIYGTHTRSHTTGPTGKATQTLSLPVPRGSQTMMQSISMDSPTDGWAVGQATPSKGDNKPIFMHYSGGVWRAVDVDFTGDIQAVSMTSAADGWAVGYGVIAHYDGQSWKLVTSNAHASLNAAQMLSPTQGWAVGYENIGNLDQYPLYAIMRYDGSSWTPQALPWIPGVTNSYFVDLFGLDMLSPTEGWAVGTAHAIDTTPNPARPNKNTPAPINAAIILHYTGGAWTLHDEIPSAQLEHVAMGSASDGWAVGVNETWTTSNTGPVGSVTPLLLRYSGGAWAQMDQPTGNGQAWIDGVQAVAALSATDVWFAGQRAPVDTNATATNMTMTRYNGGVFTSQTVSLSRRRSANITSISMLSPTEGWATGSAFWPRDDGVPSDTGYGYTPTITPLFLRYHDGVWAVTLD